MREKRQSTKLDSDSRSKGARGYSEQDWQRRVESYYTEIRDEWGELVMDQPTFSDLEYQGKKRKTRREQFLERIDALIPWQKLEGHIAPYYPKAGRGRHPYPLSVMLRIHCVQLFYNLSDPGMEDLLYESDPVRRFLGLKLTGPLPDETTILHFRHLLERHGLGESLLEEINGHLESQGLKLREGTIVDATIIAAPSSTKSRHQEPVWGAGP